MINPTKPHDFQPGDRVLNTVTGSLCTVKPTPEDRLISNADGSFVFLDADSGSAATYPKHNCHHLQLERALIEPGCWVRVVEPSMIKDIGKIIEKREKDFLIDFGSKYSVPQILPNNWLARIADPAPSVTKPDYQPGDRVLTRMGVNSIGGRLGIVIEPKPNEVTIKLDNETDTWVLARDGTRSWAIKDAAHYLERAPIEPGSWVRVLDGPNKGKTGMVKIMPTPTGANVQFDPLDWAIWTSIEYLARIANPNKPAELGFTIRIRDAEFMTHEELIKAQNLATVLHNAHYSDMPDFKLADNLSDVLDQIDNMTAGLVRVTAFRAIQDENAKLTKAVNEMAVSLREYPGSLHQFNRDWLDCYAPEPKPEFKRGDLVTWESGRYNSRIIAVPAAISHDEKIEVMFVTGNVAGETVMVRKDQLRHVK